tara:strand:+ start:1678 stop:2601 length:924 start_codon:yes stop_codon:yes gene_type:complete
MKKIILSGSTGFIGSNIRRKLSQNSKISLFNIDLRKTKEEIKLILKDNYFDYFIHSAGIHPKREESYNKKIIDENNEILKKIDPIFKRSKKIILISSFVNLVDYKKKIISEDNLLQLNKSDNFYKISKFNVEKYFLDLNDRYNKDLITLYPCHVIGPNDHSMSPNGIYFKSIMKNKLNLYFDIQYPLTDVREIASYIDFIIDNNSNSHKKIILTNNLKMIDLIKKIKKNQNFFINIRLFNFISLFFFILNFFMMKMFFLKKNYFSLSTLKYIQLNPKVNSTLNNNYQNKYVVDDTINDTLNFFKNHE